jgi:anaerobic selenocysteine-containing dehydrogenase
MSMNRREFLELLASAGVGLGLSQFPFRRLAQTNPLTPRLTAYEEVFKTAACGLCPAGCSLRTRLVNGQAVGVAGNPLDPFTGGGLCPKGFSILHQLYHPDRLKKPLKRVGSAEKSSWKTVEWEEALSEIGSELRKIMAATPERIVFLDGRPFGFMNTFIEKWMRRLGSPNHISDQHLNAFPIAARYMMGKPFYPAYQMSKLDLLVSVGDPFLDYSINPVYQARQYAEFRQQERRGRLIVFDDTKGITAEKADQFYRIEPGSHGAVLLALANVIVRYESYDKEFIETHTTGLQEWNDQALQGYTPESVEPITGVPADAIYAVASELSRAERKLVLGGSAVMTGAGGLYQGMATLALNVLLGAVDRDLKMETSVEHLFDSELLPDSPVQKKKRIDTRNFPLSMDVPWTIPDVIQSEHEAVAALFLYYSNPLASHPGAHRWQEAFKHVPLIVSFSPFLDETSNYAHWILPDSLCLERHQDFVHPPVTGMNRVTVSQPLWEKPLFDTRPTGDVLLDLIRKADPKAGEEFPWNKYEDFLDQCLRRVYQLNTGSVFTQPQEFESFMELADRGYRVNALSDENAFVKAVYGSGGWIQPTYLQGQWGRMFQTPSGRFEFASSLLKQGLETYFTEQHKTLKDFGLQDIRGIYHMPSFIPSRLSHDVGKLTWLITWNTGSQTELPWWWEVVGMHRYLQWQMWAELGTDDPKAARLDASRRPSCEFSLKGKPYQLPLVLRAGGHPRVLALPVGFQTSVVRSESMPLPRGFNVLALIDYLPDPLTGLPSYYFDIESLNVGELKL